MNIPVSQETFRRMVKIRRDLHQHPELSWKEHRTANCICAELEALGISYQRDIAGTGIIAEIPGESTSPCVVLRADMDALPVQEETGLTFSSVVPGIMHACGHDGHTSMLLGAATLLKQESKLPVSVRLLFQPAEEVAGGATALIQAGALDGAGMIFGGHLDRHYPTGTIVVGQDIMNASTDAFEVLIQGKGGHAARPHEGIDAVIVGSLLVMALQTIVSREVNPAHPSVVTVGRFDAGTAHNVIAAQARLEGTVRAQEQEVREGLKLSIERIARSIGTLHQAQISVNFFDGSPALWNSKEAVPLAQKAASDVVGEESVVDLQIANMGGEDFAHYLEHVPGCYIRIGAQVQGRENYPAHSSRFDFDEQALAVGAAYYHAVALAAGNWLSQDIGEGK